MSKYLTSINPAVVELRTMLYEYCVEAIQDGLIDTVLTNTTKFLNENASEATALKLTALTYKSMGAVLERMKRHCNQPVKSWVSQNESGTYQLETYCSNCGWIQEYGNGSTGEEVAE